MLYALYFKRATLSNQFRFHPLRFFQVSPVLGQFKAFSLFFRGRSAMAFISTIALFCLLWVSPLRCNINREEGACFIAHYVFKVEWLNEKGFHALAVVEYDFFYYASKLVTITMLRFYILDYGVSFDSTLSLAMLPSSIRPAELFLNRKSFTQTPLYSILVSFFSLCVMLRAWSLGVLLSCYVLWADRAFLVLMNYLISLSRMERVRCCKFSVAM